jgi:DNA-binding NarL/FixJ family response regulator
LKAQELKPDLVLLDISLPDLSGIETADRIRKATPGAKILFTTTDNDPDALQTVLANGADGYVLKWNVLKELVRAVEEVLCGRKFVSGQLTLYTTNSAPVPSASA